MSTQLKKGLSLLLCAVMLFGFAGLPSIFAQKAQAASGTCGTSLTWNYDQGTGTLTITGTGAMYNYISGINVVTAPWSAYYDTMKTVVIKSGATSIGKSAFAEATKVTTFTLPKSVTSIGELAFFDCGSLKEVYYGGSADDKENIDAEGWNDCLLNATWYFSPLTSAAKLTIRNFIKIREEGYKTTIRFTAITENVPEDSTVHWFKNGADSGEGSTFTVEKAKETYTIQAKLLDKDGKVLAATSVETVQIKNTFFAKILAFFRMIFGLLPNIDQ